MLNLLIIDKDINNSKRLLNYISENSSQIKVHSIANSLYEGIEILNNGLIDIVIINVDNDINSIVLSLHNISNIYFEKYRKSIIVFSIFINNKLSDPYIYKYVYHTEDISIIFSNITEIANNKIAQINSSILSNKINKELEYIGYNLSYNGTKYLSECIALIYNNYDNCENLTKSVYPIIAKKYHKTINNVKCNITSATNAMFYDCDENRLKEYFNFYTICKPKTKLVIYTILNKLIL